WVEGDDRDADVGYSVLFRNSSSTPPLRWPNDPAQQPGPLSGLRSPKSEQAGRVCCSAWFGVWGYRQHLRRVEVRGLRPDAVRPLGTDLVPTRTHPVATVRPA